MKLYYSKFKDSVLSIKKDTRTECFNFGEDNAFPNLIQVLTAMSVTTKTCVDRVSKAIYGGGFGDRGEVIVNYKGQTLNEIFRIASREYANFNNAYIHVSIDANFKYKSITVINVCDVRVGKDDDKGYSDKFIVYDNWAKQKGAKIMSSKFRLIDKFNKSYLKTQISKIQGENEISEPEAVLLFEGQIKHIKKDAGFIYSMPELTPVLSEALVEYNSQEFRASGSEEGFMNVKLLTTQPFASDESRKDFLKNLKNTKGAKNTGSVLLLEASQQTDDLQKQVKIDDLTSEYNDKLFEYSDKQAEKNICKAFSVPKILVDTTDNGSFGESGGKLREAKKQLFESREEDRGQIASFLIDVMSNFSEPVKDLTVINPYEENKEKDIDVNSLVSILTNISNKTITKEQGLKILVEVFKLSEEKAGEIIGV